MSSTSQPDVNDRYEMIARMPRPRPLRRSPIASSLAVLLTLLLRVAVVVLVLNLLWSLKTGPLTGFVHAHKGALFGLALAVVASLIVMSGQGQQKNLVKNGEVAIGTITSRFRMNRYWYVRYEFSDKNGNRLSNEAMDKTGKEFLTQGAQMLVYYFPDNPRRPVAQCESWYEPAVAGMAPDPRF